MPLGHCLIRVCVIRVLARPFGLRMIVVSFRVMRFNALSGGACGHYDKHNCNKYVCTHDSSDVNVRARTRAGVAHHRSVRRGEVSDQRASGGRSNRSGWMPEKVSSGAAMTEAAGGSGMKIPAKDEIAAAAQQAAQGGQCGPPGELSETS
jgi:hypothetical protein